MTGRTSNLHPDLLTILEELEIFMGFELYVTSGQRTVEHNADPQVGGVKNSEHTYEPAKGADVFCARSTTRYKMVGKLYAMGVRRIGINVEDKFVHIGIAEDKPQDVLWGY